MRKIRNENLLKVIQSHFEGSHLRFQERTGIKISQISQWLSPEENENSRNMGEHSARKIEDKCRLPAGWMDVDRTVEENTLVPTVVDDWPHQSVTKEQYESLPQSVRDDIDDYIQYKYSQTQNNRPRP